MKKRKLSISIIILTLLTWVSQGHSLTKETHEAINQEVTQRTINGFVLDSYLKNNLGLPKGVQELLYGYSGKKKQYITQEVYYWFGEGGWMEDVPPENDMSLEGLIILLSNNGRANNHFHNPLKTNWANAGLNDSLWLPNWYFLIAPAAGWSEHWFTGQSSILWAQNQNQNNGGNWSWRDGRNYFYSALTSTNKTQRDEYFAKTFRAVGQSMHLVEDTSVPQHTRNDIHVLPAYEKAVENMRLSNTTQWNLWMNNPITFDKSILDIPSNPAAPVPISRIIDTDNYDGTNPGITTNTNIGLSEYSNANFLSEDTMFTDGLNPIDKHYFPYPRSTGASLWIDISNLHPYLKKTGDGEAINHLAAVSLLYIYRTVYFPQYYTFLPVGLDDKCYADYAQKLIPRAVGYSAGLLDYFFRGTLEITPPAQVAYAVTDGSVTPQQFTYIKAKIRNSTPDTIIGEDIQNGILQAVAKYKIIPNYMYDLSNYPPDGTVMHDIPFSYSVSDPITITSLSSTEPTEFTFNFFSSPVPAGITDLHLFIVFKGTLGNETDIAIAVGKKDLMEPTHQVLWNLTDMFSLDNHLYTSDTIKTTPALAAMVDLDHDGVFNETDEPYIDPHPVTFGIGYLKNPPGQSNPFTYSAITVVQPGRHIRLVVLVDKPQENYLVLEETDVVMGTSYYYFAPPGVVNQEENGIWQPPTPMTTFRYGLDIDGITQIPIRQHFYTGVLKCYPVGTDPYGNPACGYPEQEAIPAELSPSPIDAVYFP